MTDKDPLASKGERYSGLPQQAKKESQQRRMEVLRMTRAGSRPPKK